MQRSDGRQNGRSTWLTLGLIFFALAVIALALAAFLRGGGDVSAGLRTFSTRFLGIFIEAAPFLLLGTVVSGVIEVFVGRDDIARLIPRNPVAAAVVGSLMGFTFPVCECGVVPVVRRLFSKGLPMSVGISFLLAAPVVNPIVLVSTYVAFWAIAPEIVILRFVITIAVAIAVGLVFALAARPVEVLRPASLAPVMGGSAEAAPTAAEGRSLVTGLIEALRIGSDEFFEMGKYLVIGTLLAAGMQTVVTQQTLISIGSGVLTSVIVMQLLAFVLSVCSTVDSFLALSFYSQGFTSGSIVSFLTFGPMVDIKSTLMFAGVFRRKAVLYLILLPLLMTMLAGLLINLNLPLGAAKGMDVFK
jgi:hypothetical protein